MRGRDFKVVFDHRESGVARSKRELERQPKIWAGPEKLSADCRGTAYCVAGASAARAQNYNSFRYFPCSLRTACELYYLAPQAHYVIESFLPFECGVWSVVHWLLSSLT
jgi:hypothetical protein